MSNIRIVTDSTADLSPEMVERYGIQVVPLTVFVEGKAYKDKIDITNDAFYDILRTVKELPTTSQPSPAVFAEVYRKLAAEGAEHIISIHISTELSGTYQSSVLAAGIVAEEVQVHNVNSRIATMGLGLLVLSAARLVEDGKSLEEVLAALDYMVQNQSLYFLLDSLDNLHKGGRIGKASHLFGSLLNIKPVLCFNDGVIGVYEKVRGNKDNKALERLIEILAECKRAGNLDMVYKFASTSKISFPGSGIAAIATSRNNLEDIEKQLKFQTISHDKVNQLRHVRYFGDIHGMVEHMRKHADILRPKFEAVIDTLERELGGLGIGTWTKPKGGYFIAFDSLDGCAKAIVARCKKAGLVMTGAGATYPYGKDPHDTNIRIAPSYPPLSDLILAMDLFALCTKIVSIDKILKDRAEAQEAPEQA